MTARRRRAHQQQRRQAAGGGGDEDDEHNDPEVVMGETALHSLDQIETSVRAFQHLWRQGLVIMGMVCAAIHVLLLFRLTATPAPNFPLAAFYIHAIGSYALISRWLNQVDVTLQFPEITSPVGELNEPFFTCLIMMLSQGLFFPILKTIDSPIASKTMPTSMLFWVLTIGCVAYSRHHIRTHHTRRKKMENVLFESTGKAE